MKRRLLLFGFLVIIFTYNLMADISYSPLQPVVNQPVVFNVSNPDGISENRAQWDFGDGTPVNWNSSVVSHQYNRAGTFVVKAMYWTNLGVSATNQIAITVREEKGYGPGAAFQISFIRLRYRDGKAYEVVPQNFRPLVVYADIKYEGTGLFTGQWLIDGMPVRSVSENLYYARSITITSGELPTLVPGRHEVSLKILSPSTEFVTPTIIYLVESRKEVISPIEPVTTIEAPEFHYLAGTVIYEDSKKPVPNVTVEFRQRDGESGKAFNRGKACTTDSQGHFMISRIPSNIFFTLEVYGQRNYFKEIRNFIGDKSLDNFIIEIESIITKEVKK